MRNLLQWLVGSCVIALFLRTWLVLGMVEPVIVSGSSMLPTLSTGQQVVVNRSVAAPQRWESVVFVNPADKGQLAVKRVVGLPGETITLRQGEVWCAGNPLVKPISVQRRLRVLVHREDATDRRWHPSDESLWRWSQDGWCLDSAPGEAVQWLDYRQPNGEPITDDMKENSGLARQLFPVRDFFLSARLQVRQPGELAFAVRDGRNELQAEVEVLPGAAQVEISNFDRQAWLALNGQVVWEQPLPSDASVVGTSSPFSLGTRGGDLSVHELTIYRDIYYLSGEEAVGYRENLPVYQVGPNEILVLGDNLAVSQDSRHWGPLPLKYLLGRVIFPR